MATTKQAKIWGSWNLGQFFWRHFDTHLGIFVNSVGSQPWHWLMLLKKISVPALGASQQNWQRFLDMCQNVLEKQFESPVAFDLSLFCRWVWKEANNLLCAQQKLLHFWISRSEQNRISAKVKRTPRPSLLPFLFKQYPPYSGGNFGRFETFIQLLFAYCFLWLIS